MGFVHSTANLLLCCDDCACPIGLEITVRLSKRKKKYEKAHSYEGRRKAMSFNVADIQCTKNEPLRSAAFLVTFGALALWPMTVFVSQSTLLMV
jgi:hypothetical protein